MFEGIRAEAGAFAADPSARLTAAYRRTAALVEWVLVGDQGDPAAPPVVGGMAVALVALLVAFIVLPSLVVFPAVAFVALAVAGWWRHQAGTARFLALVATCSTVLALALISVYLFVRALPAVRHHGAGLLALPRGRWFFWLDVALPTTDTLWNPRAGSVSLIPTIWASVVVTLIAGLVAAPLGVMGALFISHVASSRVRAAVKPGVEVLAGIPSIVYGFIGFQVLNGFVQARFLDDGASFFIAGVVVGVMALPTVVSVAEDALSSVPDEMADGALAMGATRWQTMKSISVPAASSGISAAIILGLGRAIGETMAVAAIMAAGVGLPEPLYDPFAASATLTSLIATQYGSASEGTVEVLFVAGSILFVVVATMSVVSQRIERRMQRKLQGET